MLTEKEITDSLKRWLDIVNGLVTNRDLEIRLQQLHDDIEAYKRKREEETE